MDEEQPQQATLQDRVYNAIPMTDDLSETTKVMLRGIIDRLAMLSRLDMSDVCALSILAIEYDKVLRATAAMATEDLITNGKRNPLLAVATASENTVLSLIKEFGLSTKSRKTLNERDTAPRKSNKLEGYDNPELPFGQDA